MTHMDATRLWAKSLPPNAEPTTSMFLPGHLADVYHAAERVVIETGDDQLRALGLNAEKYRDRFKRCVLLAAAVHDLGKANDHFQGMIRGVRDVRINPQGLRHEWVSVLLLRDKQLREWLLPAVDGSESDLAIVEWAVGGHHPAYDRPSPPRTAQPGTGTTIQVLTESEDFSRCLEVVGVNGPRPVLPASEWRLPLVGAGNVFLRIGEWFRDARRTLPLPDDERRFVAAIKNTLVAADVAGSAIPRQRPNDPDRWAMIDAALRHKPYPGGLQAVADLRLAGKRPRPFQELVRDSKSPVTFVKAGCGSGKTLAAYLWAAKNSPCRRLYFCYPTTGTATEGLRDYLNPNADAVTRDPANAEMVKRLEADLFHCRSDVDWEVILTTATDADRPAADAATRAEALDAWSTPVVACTVDTVLGLVQNNKRGLFGWPALAQAAFVFDEIHAFDDRLFGALLRFLRDVPGVPVLLMTASLPKARRQALDRVLADRLKEVPGPTDLEELPRYKKHASIDAVAAVREELAKPDGKVLWVCNTVGRVMAAADAVVDLNPKLYHSRFRYEDRVERHKEVIAAFDVEKHPGPALAICSQVAEMSLDLSATLLVTDLAPVPALIQRLGRLNRRAVPPEKDGDPPPPTMPFLVVTPENHLPYTPADLTTAQKWLGNLPSDDIAQKTLADAWEHDAAARPPEVVASAWLDGGPSTTVLELREASPGVTVLMEADVGRVRGGVKAARLALPMPPAPRKLDWQLRDGRGRPVEHAGIPVAKVGSIVYCQLRGATWAAPEKTA